MPVVRLVAVARRALFDEPCALLSDDRDLPTLMSVPLAPGDAPGLARILDPWLGGPAGGEVTIDLVAGLDGTLHAVVTPVPPGMDPAPSPGPGSPGPGSPGPGSPGPGSPRLVSPGPGSPGRDTPLVDAFTLSHRSRVPIRVEAGLLAEHQVDPGDVDRVVPIADQLPLVPTAEQQQRLARAFSALEEPDPGR